MTDEEIAKSRFLASCSKGSGCADFAIDQVSKQVSKDTLAKATHIFAARAAHHEAEAVEQARLAVYKELGFHHQFYEKAAGKSVSVNDAVAQARKEER